MVNSFYINALRKKEEKTNGEKSHFDMKQKNWIWNEAHSTDITQFLEKL